MASMGLRKLSGKDANSLPAKRMNLEQRRKAKNADLQGLSLTLAATSPNDVDKKP